MFDGEDCHVITVEELVEVTEGSHSADPTTPLLVGCCQETVWGHLQNGECVTEMEKIRRHCVGVCDRERGTDR